ncbi:MAG: cysteine synthase family protein [Planctomycetota bacterium]|nr:cysteine synthase family protein [Planctomycetota bacterium]
MALVGGTRLVRVPDEVTFAPDDLPGCEVWAKAEWMNPGGSIKDRPVLRMLLEAELAGELRPGRAILDSSSGNAGIAYAMIGAMLGREVQLVVPGNASLERKRRILAHGARLLETDPLEGYDEALRTCHRLHEEHPERYWLSDQYSNEHNWRAHHETTAVELLEQTEGKLTHFVAGIGTGGTITGVGRRLKEHDPSIRVIAVIPDPFPGIEGLKPLERPEDIRPKILDDSVIDERVRVGIEDAFDYCHRLARRGLFVGQSSGAVLKAIHEVARRERRGRFVTVFADLGERYFSTGLWDGP